MDHDTRVRNLKDDLSKTGKTILEYYMDLCQKSDGIQQFAKTLTLDSRKAFIMSTSAYRIR